MTTVLTICTGNVCRSPAMELVLRRGVAGTPGLQERGIAVESAGVRALVGSPIDPRMLVALGDPQAADDFVARQVDEHLIAGADLVLTATRRQRSAVVTLLPSALPKTYTLAEFARYCAAYRATQPPHDAGGSSEGPLATLIAFAGTRRGGDIPRRLEDDDIGDPYGRSLRVHRRVAKMIDANIATVLAALEHVGTAEAPGPDDQE